MSQKILGVLAIVLVFGSAELPTSAFARGGHDGRYGDSSLGSRGHPSAGGIGMAGGGYSSDDSRTSGLHGGFNEFGRRDAWGHWGAYYGPMIHGL
jgi:hypothetical protein